MTMLDIAPQVVDVSMETADPQAELAQMRADMVVAVFGPNNEFVHDINDEQLDTDINVLFQNGTYNKPFMTGEHRVQDTIIRNMKHLPVAERQAIYGRLGSMANYNHDTDGWKYLDKSMQLTERLEYSQNRNLLGGVAARVALEQEIATWDL